MVEHTPTRLLLDPWSADYPGSVQADGGETAETGVQIDTCVETRQWSPVPAGNPPESAAFVDGIRRLEARVIGSRNDGMIHGAFASFATGAAIVAPKTAAFAHCVTARRLILTSGLRHTETLRAGNTDLHFRGPRHPGGESGCPAACFADRNAPSRAEAGQGTAGSSSFS
jgi:hypothetical protein